MVVCVMLDKLSRVELSVSPRVQSNQNLEPGVHADQALLTTLSTNKLLLTASFLPEPRTVPVAAPLLVSCNDLPWKIRQAFSGAAQLLGRHGLPMISCNLALLETRSTSMPPV